MELVDGEVYNLCSCIVAEQKKEKGPLSCAIHVDLYINFFSIKSRNVARDISELSFSFLSPASLFPLFSSAGTSGKCNGDSVRRNISIHAAGVRFLADS